jgi:hypothetical protein
MSYAGMVQDYGSSGGGAGGLIVMIIELAIAVLAIAGMWKTFAKAGEPGWAAIIPIYNIFVLLKIAGKPAWWIILFLIPVVSFIIFILVGIEVAKKFGKGAGFGVGLALLGFIFFPMLGFGDATFQGGAPAPAR